MGSALTRRSFYTFLQDEGQHDLLGFWSAVEELRHADRTLWHQLATEAFYGYVNKPSDDGAGVQVSRPVLKRIEAFLVGDSPSPDVFFYLQESVAATLREQHFPAFVASPKCRRMIEETAAAGIALGEPESCPEGSETSKGKTDASAGAATPSVPPDYSGPSGFAKSHLESVSEKLQNKLQALTALRRSLKPDSKVLSKLQAEVDSLNAERKEVNLHIERTESWAEHLGKWRCHVKSVEHGTAGTSGNGGAGGGGGCSSGSGGHGGVGDGEKEGLVAVLIVHLPQEHHLREQQRQQENKDEESSNRYTWTCVRKVADLHALHRDLVPYVSWIKSLELPPSNPKSIFGGIRGTSNANAANRAALERARVLVQRYLDCILTDEQLNQSEIVYAFLSPSPSHLKSGLQVTTRRNSKFSPFSNLFNRSGSGNSGNAQCVGGVATNAEDAATPAVDKDNFELLGLSDELTVFDEFDSASKISAAAMADDTVAETVYALIGEVFDMRGVFRWLRKSLIAFVQITYGGSMSRQVQETVTWLTSESMVLRYLHSFKKAFWTNDGTLKPERKPLDPGTADRARAEARAAVMSSIPEVLVNLVGQQAALAGTAKVFDTLQNQTLNKQARTMDGMEN